MLIRKLPIMITKYSFLTIPLFSCLLLYLFWLDLTSADLVDFEGSESSDRDMWPETANIWK